MPTREAHIVVLEAAGAVRWRYDAGRAPEGWLDLAPARPPVDGTGHIFINYDPAATTESLSSIHLNGFQDFATLPPEAEFTQRLYSATVVDEDRNGVYEVLSSINYCEPSCADGSYIDEYFDWDGQEYVSRGAGE